MIVERSSLVAEVKVDTRVDRFEAACFAQGCTPGPLTDADPGEPLEAALVRRAGRRSPRYGDLWDRVLALEAELPAGRVVRTRAAPRAATGPDITRTILEGRGRLGRLIRVWMRLWPAPRERAHLSAAAPLPEAIAGLAAVLRAGVRPAEAALEGSAATARLALRFEGEPRRVEAEVVVARDALSSRGLVPESGAFSPGVARASSPEGGRLVEAPWSELPERARALAGAGTTARLAWLSHEAAGISLSGAAHLARADAARARAEALVAEIAAALARRCA